MEKQSMSGIISGCLNQDIARSCPLELVLLWFRFVSLFYPNSRIWDPGKLASCFLSWEAEKVGGLYAGEDEAEDVLIWPLSPPGNYSVRSAYCMLMEAELLLCQAPLL